MIGQPQVSSAFPIEHSPCGEDAFVNSGGGQSEGRLKSADMEDFLVAVSRLNSAISDSPLFSKQGIGPASWSLLKVLENETLSTEQLIQRTGLSRQRLSVQVKELEAKQLLAVTQQNVGDRRSRNVHILPQGADILEEVSQWLGSLNQGSGGKKALSAVKYTKIVQRLFLQEKRAAAKISRRQKKNKDGVSERFDEL